MELKPKLTLVEASTKSKERVKEAAEKKKTATYEPSWEEVWITGYGKKKGIFQMSNTGSDPKRLEEIKEAVEAGEIGISAVSEITSLRKLTKQHALNLYKALVQQRKAEILCRMVENTPANYLLIDNELALNKLVKDLEKEDIVGLDTETTGLDVYKDTLVGMSWTLPKADYHVYIPTGHTTGRQLPLEHVLKALAPLLVSKKLGKVLHNAKFDLHMFIRHGVLVRGVAHDTRVAMAVLNENEPSYALKNLATKYGKFFGFKDESHTFEELFGKNAKFAEVPLDVALVYACKDTHLTYKLYKWQMTHLRKRSSLLELYLCCQ